MKHYLFFSIILMILSAGCSAVFYQGYPDELYQSSVKSSRDQNSADNRHIYSGSTQTNETATVENNETTSTSDSWVANPEPRTYLSVAIGTPAIYSVFVTPFYYDWWYFPYYGSFWYVNNPWYWDPFWNPYWDPFYYRPYYAWYNPWWCYYCWDNLPWWYFPSNYPRREHLSYRPEPGNYRQSLRHSISTALQMPAKRSNMENSEGPRPQISNRTTNHTQSVPNQNYGSGSISTGRGSITTGNDNKPNGHGSLSTSRPMMLESDADKPSGRITHTRDLQTGSGSITRPIHHNNKIELPSESESINRRNNNTPPNNNSVTPSQPRDAKPSGQGSISPNATGLQNRGRGSGSLNQPSGNNERNNNRIITTQPSNQPTYHSEPARHDAPPRSVSPSAPSAPANRESLRGSGSIRGKN